MCIITDTFGSYTMAFTQQQQDDCPQWNPSSNLVGQPANIFDFPVFEWPALEFDGSFPAEVGYSGLPLSTSPHQNSLDGHQDTIPGVINLDSESQNGKKSKLRNGSAVAYSDQSAIEVRRFPYVDS